MPRREADPPGATTPTRLSDPLGREPSWRWSGTRTSPEGERARRRRTAHPSKLGPPPRTIAQEGEHPAGGRTMVRPLRSTASRASHIGERRGGRAHCISTKPVSHHTWEFGTYPTLPNCHPRVGRGCGWRAREEVGNQSAKRSQSMAPSAEQTPVARTERRTPTVCLPAGARWHDMHACLRTWGTKGA